MVFAKNEVLELFNGKKYIVVETINQNNIWYYYVCEVNNEENKIKEEFKIITTVSENGNLFIKTVKGKLQEKLELIFKEKLQID